MPIGEPAGHFQDVFVVGRGPAPEGAGEFDLLHRALDPVEGCITMEHLAPGAVNPRTGETVREKHGDWTTRPNNPMRVAAE